MFIKKRNKKISILIVSCATIAVATVGFSSWIIGLFQSEVNANFTNIQVDSTRDRTKYINIELESSAIHIGEISSVSDNGQINVEATSNNNLDVLVKNFDIAFNNTTASFSSITFLTTISEGGSLIYNISASENDIFKRESGKYTFIELNRNDLKNINEINSYFTKKTIGNYTLYTLNKTISENPYSKLGFKRGSLFDYKDPSTFYQSKFNNASLDSTENKLKMLSQMETELTYMKNALNNKTITVKATLEINFNEVSA